jgi:hypothetical protein
LECITVQGEFPREKTTSNKVLGHQWNLVYDGHRWLMVDCTFDMASEDHRTYFMISPNIDGRISWYSLDY